MLAKATQDAHKRSSSRGWNDVMEKETAFSESAIAVAPVLACTEQNGPSGKQPPIEGA